MSKHAERLRREAQELRAGRKQAPDKEPSGMTPEELDVAIEEQSALVRRLKEEELRASREATNPRTSSVIAGLNTASRRRRMFK